MTANGNEHHPILVLIRGLPGSGKSYISDMVRAQLGEDRTVMLDPDATDYKSAAYHDFSAELTAQGVEQKFHPYRFLRAQAHHGISAGQIILWNQPFTDRNGFIKTIINLQTYAREHGATLSVLVVEVMTDPVTAHSRVEARKRAGGHGPSEATFARFERDYVSFADEGHPTITVSGDDNAEVAAQAIVKALQDFPAAAYGI